MAKTLEVSHVAPFKDDSPRYSLLSDFSLPLTFFDTFWLKFLPVERLFFYSLAEPSRDFFFDSVLPKLKHSLSLTLRHFLPIAGKITWPRDSPKPLILYRAGSDAVSMTVAESDADFDVLSGDGPFEAALFRGLVPGLSVSESGVSVASLQVTLFPDKGFCIGFTNHHGAMDGKSATMFVKAWAYLCREEPPLLPELTPFYDRSVIEDPKGLDMLYLKQWSELSRSSCADPKDDPKLFDLLPLLKVPPEIVRATFEFSRADIAKLRQQVLSAKSGRNDDLHLSSFVLTSSYVLLCIVKATKESGDKVFYGFSADYRRRLEPPVPENYFGNCLGAQIKKEDIREIIASAAEEDAGGALTAVAASVSEMVGNLEAKDAMEGAEEWLLRLSWVSSGRAIGVAGSPRFGVYETDFGWGRPRKVDVASIDRTGALFMAESRDGSGGIEVGVVLQKHEMEIFRSVLLEGLKSHQNTVTTP